MRNPCLRTRLGVLFCVATVLLTSLHSFSQENRLADSKVSPNAAALKTLRTLNRPLTFEVNRGQTDTRARFLSHAPGYELFLTADGAQLSLSKARIAGLGEKKRSLDFEPAETVRVGFVGANSKSAMVGEGELAGKSNYYLGNDPKRWQTGIPNYSRVRYSAIYPGIDLVFYGNQGTVEHDFVVAPGADAKQIQLALDGAKSVRVDTKGDLLINLEHGAVRLLKPVVYQEMAGKRREVKGRYKLTHKVATFDIGRYDKRRELIIDPKLNYSTFLGGSSGDEAYGVAVQGDTMYVTGDTTSPNFPTSGSGVTTQPPNSVRNAFVSAISLSGGFVYSTYLGGANAPSIGRGIAVDSTGTAYVGGYTYAGNFPTGGSGLATSYHGGVSETFVAKLSSTGALVSSGFLGGSGDDQVSDLSFDPVNSRVLVSGYTSSTDFPVVNPSLATLPGQLYRSANAAGAWSLRSGTTPNAIGSMDVFKFLIVPGSLAPTRYYVGGTAGVYTSTDALTWSALNNGLAGAPIYDLVSDPNATGGLYAASANGVGKYSPASGQWSWQLFGVQAKAVAVDPTNANRVYLAGGPQGLYVSSDAGSTWSQSNSGLPASHDVEGLIVTATGTLYVALNNVSPAVYTSTNGGVSWTATTNTGLGFSGTFYLQGNPMALDPSSGKIYIGGNRTGAYVSSDGANTWTKLGTLPVLSTSVNCFGFDPLSSSTLYIGTADGLWKSIDSGNTFTRSDSGFAGTSIHTIAIDQAASASSGSTVLYAGAETYQGFVTSLDASLNIVFSTPFGGDGPGQGFESTGYRVRPDSQGNVFVGGFTASKQIQGIASGAQSTFGGTLDALLMKFSSSGSPLWSTYLGGSENDTALALGVAPDGSAVLAGFTNSTAFGGAATTFPTTAGAYQTSCSSGTCTPNTAFVAKYSPSGTKVFTTLINAPSGFGTFLFGAAGEANGNVLVAGSATGPMPTANPLDQPTSNGGAFVAELNSTGSALLFSTELGGSNSGSGAYDMALDSNGAIYVVGQTPNADFPTAGPAVQSIFGGSSDAFIAQITNTGVINDLAVQVTPASPTLSSGTQNQFNVTVSNLTTTGNGASNVVLTTNLAVTGLSSSLGTCTISPARCALGTVPPGASVVITAMATYATTGTFINTFSVRTDDNDPNPANNTQSVTATVVTPTGNSDLAATMTAPSVAPRNTQFTYTLSITNLGTDASNAVTVPVSLDPSLIVVSLDSSCYIDGGVFCNVNALIPGSQQQFLITVQSPSTSGVVTSSATVTYVTDPNATNNTGTATTTIAPSADLSVFPSVYPYLTIGAPLPVDLSIFNGGPDAATNVTLTLHLPPQLSLTASTMSCSGPSSQLTCTVGPVAAGNNVAPQFAVVANSPGVFTIPLSISDSGSSDPNPADNSYSLSLTASDNSGSEYYVVSNTSDGSISAFPAGSAVTSFSITASGPAAPAISTIDITGRYVYVTASGFSGYTSVVDTTVQREVARIHGVQGRPMVTTPDGSRLIARSVSLPDTLAVVDTTTFQVVRTISLDGVFGDQVGVADLLPTSGVVANNKLYLQVSYIPPTGTPLYTTAVVDLGTFAVSQVSGASTSAPIPQQQRTVVASADGTRVYALRRAPGSVLVIDTSSDTVLNTISLPVDNTAAIIATRDPNDPQGQFAYVSGRRISPTIQNSILVLDLNHEALLPGEELVSFFPTNLVITADGNFLHGIRSGVVAGNNALFVSTADVRSGTQSLQTYSVGPAAGGLSIGFLSTSMFPFAPSISSTVPASIDNATPNTVSILGSNFAPGARVKIGPLDATTATFVSTGRLDVSLPALTPENDGHIIVTLPNPQELPTRRNISGISSFKLHVGNAAFPLPNSIMLLQSGNSTISVIDTAKNGVGIATLANPLSIAIARDNATVYVSSPIANTGIQAISLATGQPIVTIPLLNDSAGYQDGLATAVDPVDGKAVLYFNSGDTNRTNDQLSIVDADSTSPTFNQVKRVITTNDGSYFGPSGALAASLSGRYIYSFADAYDRISGAFLSTNLIAYDTLNGTFHQLTNVNSAFNGDQNVPNHLRVSPDGNWLIMPGGDGSIKALNITADPMLGNYTAVTISDPGHSYKTFQVVGSRLFAFDANTNTVTAFNFLTATGNFGKLGSVTLPGSGSYYEAPLLVEPTGTYVYVALKDQNVIAVLDANKVAASDPTALLDRGGDSSGIEAILLATPLTPQVDLASQFTQAFPTPQGSVSAYVAATVANNSVNTAHNVVVTITMPPGVTATVGTWLTLNGQQGGLCTGTSSVVCNIPQLQGGSPSGDSANLYVAFTAPNTLGNIAFSMNAKATEADANPQNDNASINMTIVPGADLGATATFPTGPLTAGQHVTYKVTTSNLGPSAAGQFFVDVFGLNNQVITPPAGVTCDSGGTVCTVASLAPNSQLVFTVDGDVASATSAFLNASVNPSSVSDPDYSNNYASADIPVASGGATADHFLLTDRARGQGYGLDPSTLGENGALVAGVTPNSVVPVPGGRTAFVINLEANYVSVVDITVGREIYRIQGEPGRVAALTANATQIIIANRFDPTLLDVYDSTTFAFVRHISIAAIPNHVPVDNMFIVGSNLYLMLHTAGQIYVVNLSNDSLSAIASTQTYGSIRSSRFAITPDGSTLVAAGGGDPTTPATLYLINTTSNTVTRQVPLPTNTATQTLAVTPSGSTVNAYVSMDSTLQMFDLTSGSPTFGQFRGGVAVPLPFAATSSVITSDGTTLGFAISALNQYPNVASVPVANLQSEPFFATQGYFALPGVIAATITDFLPPSNAPQIASISPPLVINNTAQTVQITGTNFSPDAVVKVGAGNPIVPSNVTPDGTQITLTLPALTESGSINVVVINRNSQQPLASRNVVSFASQLFVSDSPTFNAQYDAYAADYGNNTVVTNGSKGAFTGPTQVSHPWGIAVTTGDVWYVTSYTDQAVESSLGGEGTTRISFNGGVGYGDAIAVVPDVSTGRTVALVPSYYSPTPGTYDWQLNVIDVDPYSPTLNTVLRSIPANISNASQTAAGFGATPDGKFAYQEVVLTDLTAKFVIYNLANGQVTIQNPASLGIDAFVQGIQASPDSKFLAVANVASRNIKVFSLGNPASPTPKATIPIANPNAVPITNCCNLRIVGNKLYAYDPGSMTLQAFNFNPTTPDFSAQGLLQLPGHVDPTFQGGLAVSPDGAFVYAAEMDDDAIDVIDPTKIAAGNAAQAILARFSSQGTAPVSISLNPVPTFSNTADISVSVNHTPDPIVIGSNLTYNVSITNLGPSPSGLVVFSDVLPAGMKFVGATGAGPNTITCVGTTVVSCSVGTMSLNAVENITLLVSTTGASGGSLINTVQVTQVQSAVPDPNPANNVATDIAIVGAPDLTVTVTPDNQAPSVNGTVNYTVTVKNNGLIAASNVVVTLTQGSGSLALPNGTFPNCTHNFNNPLQNLVCTYVTIAPGTTVSFTEAGAMPSTTGVVNLTTVAQETETDANAADNTVITTISVGGGADVSVTAGGLPVSISGVPIYTVTVKNNGPGQATGVVLTDDLDRFQFVSATSTVGTCSFDGIKVSCALGTMANGASATVKIGVNPPASGWASNQYAVTTTSFDPNGGNNSANMGPFGGTVGNTGAGLNILVDAQDVASGVAANFLFASVTKPGLTRVSSVAATQAPAGYRFGKPALVYDLSTTAAYIGNIRVALQLSAVNFRHLAKARLFHLENGTWVDRTASVDAAHAVITGVTNSLSPFIIVEPLNSVPVANAGANQTVAGSGNTGSAVSLTGAASTDADSDALTYKWTGPFPEGNGTVTGANPTITMPLGASQVSLVVNDGEADSASASVNIVVSDFLIGAPSSQLTLLRGQSTSFNVVLSPKYGSFDKPVTLTCGNLPAGVTCSFVTDSVTPGAQGTSATVTLTAASSAAVRQGSTRWFAFWLGGFPVIGVLLAGKRRRWFTLLLLAIVVLALIAGMVACGGGGGASTGTSHAPGASSATITITGTSGGLQHSSNATVLLQ